MPIIFVLSLNNTYYIEGVLNVILLFHWLNIPTNPLTAKKHLLSASMDDISKKTYHIRQDGASEFSFITPEYKWEMLL